MSRELELDQTWRGVGSGRELRRRGRIPAEVLVRPLRPVGPVFRATADDVDLAGLLVASSIRPPIDAIVELDLWIDLTAQEPAGGVAIGTGPKRRGGRDQAPERFRIDRPRPCALRCRAEVVTLIPGVGFGCRFLHRSPTTAAQLGRLIAARERHPRAVVRPAARRWPPGEVRIVVAERAVLQRRADSVDGPVRPPRLWIVI